MRNRKYSVLNILLLGCVLLGAMFLGGIHYHYKTPDLEIKGDYIQNMNDGWKYQWDTGKEQGVITLPKKLKVPPGARSITIKNILPKEEIRGAVLCIRASQQTVEVKVAGKVIYKYELMPGRKFGSTVGSAWHIVKLPRECRGQTVEVRFQSEYKEYKGRINKIYIGNKGSIILELMKITTFPYSISVFIGVSGIIMLLCGIIMKEVRGTKNNLIYLSSFIILTAIWSVCESKRLQFYIANQYLIYSITYISLNLIPVPLLIFMKNKYELEEREWYTGLGYCYLVNFVLLIIVQITNKADFIEMLGNTYILIMGAIALIGYTIRKQVKEKKITQVVFWGYTAMTCAAIIDVVRIRLWRMYDAAVFSRIGVTVFIVLLGVDSLKHTIKMNEDRVKAQALAELAYRDVMTGVKNRRAFQVYTEEINKQLCKEDFVGIIAFDVNNLKVVNDVLGHIIGDDLIIQTSIVLQDVFGAIGEIFRTGGDEFVVILEGITKDGLKEYTKLFKKTLEQYNENTSRKISVAYGYDYYRYKVDKDIYESFARADRKMYHNKYKQKESNKYKQKESNKYKNKNKKIL